MMCYSNKLKGSPTVAGFATVAAVCANFAHTAAINAFTSKGASLAVIPAQAGIHRRASARYKKAMVKEYLTVQIEATTKKKGGQHE